MNFTYLLKKTFNILTIVLYFAGAASIRKVLIIVFG